MKVYDSLFTYFDKETVKVIHDIYQDSAEKLTITVCRSQKQRGCKDCGLFAITFVVSLVFGLNPSKLKFHHAAMRAPLVDCFTGKLCSHFHASNIHIPE